MRPIDGFVRSAIHLMRIGRREDAPNRGIDGKEADKNRQDGPGAGGPGVHFKGHDLLCHRGQITGCRKLNVRHIAAPNFEQLDPEVYNVCFLFDDGLLLFDSIVSKNHQEKFNSRICMRVCRPPAAGAACIGEVFAIRTVPRR